MSLFALDLYVAFFVCFIFYNYTATTEIYTLSLHDALPISTRECRDFEPETLGIRVPAAPPSPARRDRKSTRLNSSHRCISYAVFCLKKKICRTQLFQFNETSCEDKWERGAADFSRCAPRDL